MTEGNVITEGLSDTNLRLKKDNDEDNDNSKLLIEEGIGNVQVAETMTDDMNTTLKAHNKHFSVIKIDNDCFDEPVDDLYFLEGSGEETAVFHGTNAHAPSETNDSVDFEGNDDLYLSDVGDAEFKSDVKFETVDKSLVNVSAGNESLFQRTPRMLRQESCGKGFVKGKAEHLVTSTPFANRNVTGSYTTPARLVLEKWKPSCLATNHDNASQSWLSLNADVSRIVNAKAYNSVTNTEKCDETEFEEAFSNLYATLFGEDEKGQGDPDTNVRSKTLNKLEVYHNDIVKQHKRDSEKFDEILSDISSNRNLINIDEYVVHSLSTIGEESSGNLSNIEERNKAEEINEECGNISSEKCDDIDCNKTLMADKKIKDDVALNFKESPTRISGLEETVINDEHLDTDDDDDELGIPLPIEKGSLSITYRTQKELTLDEENALLESDDDDDIVSLQCSEIFTPRSTDSCVVITTNEEEPIVVDDSPSVTSKVNVNVSVEASSSAIGKTFQLELPIKEEIETEEKQEPTVKSAISLRSQVFVSSDPKENEDNDNPEWQLLKKLKTDKERYKALRERWRSVVIPNPNIDLTCQNYRQRRLHEAAIDKPITSVKIMERKGLKRPYPAFENDDATGPAPKRRKCVLFFQNTISGLLKKLEFKRFCLFKELDSELFTLAQTQENDIALCQLSTNNQFLLRDRLSKLRSVHTEQVCQLRELYVKKIEKAEAETKEYVNTLQGATEEVYSFYKFYEDLDATSEHCCSLYLTDEQFNDIVETEWMLDLYEKFYPAS